MTYPEPSDDDIEALREAIGESQPTSKHAEQREEIARDLERIRVALAPDEPARVEIPPHIRARLKASGDASWRSRYPSAPDSAPSFQVISIEGHGSAAKSGKSMKRRHLLWLTAAAAITVLGVISSILWQRSDPSHPTFVWNNAPDPEQRYDVWILPEQGHAETVPALFFRGNVRSPLAITDMDFGKGNSSMGAKRLDPDRHYRVLVCLANIGPLGGRAETFTPLVRVKVEAPTAAQILRRLIDGHRFAEARKVLEALPEKLRADSEVKTLADELRRKSDD